MKHKLNFLALIFVLAAFLSVDIVSFAEANSTSMVESPQYVRSYWWEGQRPSTDPDIIFIEINGYRGYISKLREHDFGWATYGGTLYHSSVKNIPAPTKINDTVFNDKVINSQSKYVTKTIAYPYNWRTDDSKIYPMTVYYDDGLYRGYISHTEDLPIEKTKNTIYITYGGYVYKGAYPSPFAINDTQK
ncbi:MAG: hypothetical protein Q4D77_06260 [Peptostreptococcaceae bacterium]|nr:hypothetical protein [Peptostreptococcaceae bacterium]